MQGQTCRQYRLDRRARSPQIQALMMETRLWRLFARPFFPIDGVLGSARSAMPAESLEERLDAETRLPAPQDEGDVDAQGAHPLVMIAAIRAHAVLEDPCREKLKHGIQGSMPGTRTSARAWPKDTERPRHILSISKH